MKRKKSKAVAWKGAVGRRGTVRGHLLDYKDGVQILRTSSGWWLYYAGTKHMTGKFTTKKKCTDWYEKGGR